MQYSEEDIRHLSERVELCEKLLVQPVMTRREMKTIIAAIVVTAVTASIALLAEMYLIYQVGKLYTLLDSV